MPSSFKFLNKTPLLKYITEYAHSNVAILLIKDQIPATVCLAFAEFCVIIIGDADAKVDSNGALHSSE